MVITFPDLAGLTAIGENKISPKRVEGIFYRQEREGFKNGRKGEISLK
jgi:hypothetical protein